MQSHDLRKTIYHGKLSTRMLLFEKLVVVRREISAVDGERSILTVLPDKQKYLKALHR